MKILVVGLLVSLSVLFVQADGYVMNDQDKKVAQALYQGVNRLIVRRPLAQRQSYTSSVIKQLQQFIQQVDQPRVKSIVQYVIDQFVPVTVLHDTGTIQADSIARVTTGSERLSPVITGSESMSPITTGSESLSSGSAIVDSQMSMFTGVCGSQFNQIRSGSRVGFVRGHIRSDFFDTVFFVQDGVQCFPVGFNYEKNSSIIQSVIFDSQGVPFTMSYSSLLSLKRLPGVFSDYFLLPISIPFLQSWGTGTVYGIMNTDGIVLIPSGEYRQIEYLGNNTIRYQDINNAIHQRIIP